MSASSVATRPRPLVSSSASRRATLTGIAVALTALAAALTACPAPKPTAGTADAAALDLGTRTSTRPAEAPARPDPPRREATREETARALAQLEKWVQSGATDPRNPWAVAHGIVAFGKDLKTSTGKSAVDEITRDNLVQEAGPGGAKVWRFRQATEIGIPVEPHRDLMIKTFLEAGVDRSRSLPTKAGKVTLDRLIADAEKSFAFPGPNDNWFNFAWSAYTFLLSRGPADRVRTSAGDIGIPELAERTMARLEIEQRFLEELMVAGKPEQVEKRKQLIYGHHCGGLHFVQAGVLAAAKIGSPELLARARRQLDIVLFRWDAERRIYEEALRAQPKYRWLLLVQQLKFFGHVLETFALARDNGVLPSDPELDRKLRVVAADLVDVVDKLEPAYASQDAIGASVPQTKYDLIGDGCHAIRGLRRGLVAFFAPSP